MIGWIWGYWRYWPGFIESPGDSYKVRERLLSEHVVNDWHLPRGGAK